MAVLPSKQLLKRDLQLGMGGIDGEDLPVAADQQHLAAGVACAVLLLELRGVVHLQQIEPRVAIAFEGQMPVLRILELAGHAYDDQAAVPEFS